MLSIFICENDKKQRKQFENIIINYLRTKKYNFHVTISTSKPYEILDCLETKDDKQNVYFLDILLNDDMSGIELAIKIRRQDPDAKIIFLTRHSEHLSTVFTYKIEVLDYILKHNAADVERRICECLQIAYDYHNRNSKLLIPITIDGGNHIFKLSDIMFFETASTPHKVNIHLADKIVSTYSSLVELEKLSSSFLRVHRAFLVNKNNIQSIDYRTRELFLHNGEKAPISIRKMRLLKSII